jgi:3-deoxy-manno-octulosonate cytidylyltransferase (CMP-KDO synthetase)
MKILCVIPSRMGSTRLTRKPLRVIQGKPMVQWVYENAKKCTFIDEVVVATDHEEIASVIKECGGQAIMTPENIETGSDRVAMVAREYSDMDVVINLQGDEPFVRPDMLQALVSPYLNGEAPDMATLASPLNFADCYDSPDFVKVITDMQNNAIYFSRAPIPFLRRTLPVPVYHHIGLYAFQRDFLLHYTGLPQTPLEQAESLEQLRAIEHGYKIRVSLTNANTLEINTAEELERAQQFLYAES